MNAEILAPAGNRDAFEAALAAGADAVYFALPLFGARAFAKNFSLKEAGEVISRAHLYGMKTYITMNTLLEEDQMEQAARMAEELMDLGVDALIIQDLGLIHLLHHRFPELELHASTQLSVNTPEQVETLKKMGVTRVVLARECTLDEIEACKKAGLELEVFVHGALCISYSGQCQFSNIRFGRSGNKGACAQPCRMEYTLLEDGKTVPTDGKFLLSPKDLSVLQEIPELEKAGVDSLKIEGRMKSPVYVYESVQKARKAREGKKLTRTDLDELKSAFNRGYTTGHLHSATGLQLMNPAAGNHQGIPVGEVIKTVPGRVTIRLSAPLHQNDGIRFINRNSEEGCHVNFMYDNKGKLISEGHPGETVSVKTDLRTWPGSQVRKTIDSVLEKEVRAEVEHPHRQIPASFHVIARKPQDPLELILTDGIHTIHVQGDPLQEAKSRPADQQSFEKQLKKTGDTFVQITEVTCDLDQPVFVPIPAINALKRKAIDELAEVRMAARVKPRKEYQVTLPVQKTPEDIVEVHLLEQVAPAKEEQLPVFSDMGFQGTEKIALLTPDKKKNASRKKGKQADLKEAQTEQPAQAAKIPTLVNHLNPGRIIKGVNVSNSYAIAALLEAGYEGAVLSEEMSEENRRAMMEAFKNRYGFEAPVVQTVYEKPRLMIMNHCPVNTVLEDGTRINCSRCHQKKYELLGKDGKKARMLGNPICQMELFDEEPLDKMDQMKQFEEDGIHAFRLVFSDENASVTKRILEKFKTSQIEAGEQETNR